MLAFRKTLFPSITSLLICAICVLMSQDPALAGLAKWDFEDGTLQGWTTISGDAGKLPTDADDDRYGGNFGKQGTYFIGTYESMKDPAVVELRSPEFTISTGWISLLVGGGCRRDATCITLRRASDGEILARATGVNAEKMFRRVWDVSAHKGERVYLQITDSAVGGWGHINVDDIREMTAAEVAAAEQSKKAKEARQAAWLEDLTKPGGRKIYAGRELDDIAMSLGGIGAGNIAVCGDGALRQWQFMNNINKDCVVPGQIFAVRAEVGGKAVSKVLRSSDIDGLPRVKATEFIGEFPLAEVRYKDPELPVAVRMEAFSPFIPMNARESGTPGVYFIFRVKNPGPWNVKVSLLATLQNAVGYDGYSEIKGIENPGYGGNENGANVAGQGVNQVLMSSVALTPGDKQFGTMALGTTAPTASIIPQFDDMNALWADFTRDGVLTAESPHGPSPKGKTWNGAIATGLHLKPGEEQAVVFFIAWHFPNLHADYDANLAKYRLGRMYNNWFKNAGEVGQYMGENAVRLSKATRLFRDTFFDTTMPYWFANRISAPTSTLTSQTCIWIEDGTFHAFEGCGNHGCCPMNCTHVWNYEQTLAYLFPELERNMRRTDLTIQQNPSGEVRHRTTLPLTIPRGTNAFVDGQLGTILKAYRDYKLCPDGEWLDEMWPNIRKAMDFVIREWDPNADGVLVNEQWNTYDAAMYGPNTFIGTLYLAALRASAEMAKVQGEKDTASRYRELFMQGRTRLDQALWNGEYYVHIDTLDEAKSIPWAAEDWPKENAGANRPYGAGCHADQLLGQWWASILDLGYLLPKDRVGTTLDSIMKYTWVWDFAEVPQQRAFAGDGDMGLLNCAWPKDERPAQAILYADETWTGIEYEVAGLLLQEGKVREAYQVVKAIDDRYNGVRRPPIMRNPWNEIECGDHYARAMSSWGILLAAQGFRYSGPDGRIAFSPVIEPENHRSFFSTAEGYGTFTQRWTSASQADSILVKQGKLTLREVTFRRVNGSWPKSMKLSIAGKTADADILFRESDVILSLKQPVTLVAGQDLTFRMTF